MRTAYLLCGDSDAAQDLTQTALLNLCKSWRKVKRAESVDAYAHRVLINAYLAHQSKAAKTRAAERDSVHEAQPSNSADTDTTDAADLRMALFTALDELGPGARAVVVLRYWEDMTIAATAAALGCSEGNVKSQSSRALARLRELLKDSDATSPAGTSRSGGPTA
jgi:RNA polymerase sigma factor (sigma-70 family)